MLSNYNNIENLYLKQDNKRKYFYSYEQKYDTAFDRVEI